MAFADLSNVLQMFGGSPVSEEAQDKLYKQVLMMTLAQASTADANIHPMEIETIQQIMRREAGQDLTEVDVRRALRSDVNKSARFRKYLRRARAQLNAENKALILKASVDVIKSDAIINVLEIDFFNQVAEALQMTPAEQYGLTA